jgi:hypothetical protein
VLRRNPNEVFQIEAVELALQKLERKKRENGKDVKQKAMSELDVCAMALIWDDTA